MTLPTATTLPVHGLPGGDVRDLPAADLRRWLQDGVEIALLDVREHGEYGEGHPFLAVHAPYSRLEPEAQRLVPRLDTRIVVFDHGAGSTLAQRAVRRLRALGYTGVHRLQGGAPAWRATGAALFQGVNLPSKTFGEQVEHAFDVPHIAAAELQRRLQAGEALVLLDGRTLEEHRKMTIPGAIPLPNGELALRWRSVVPDASVPVVVHCAGRTRSIVGAQILRDLGLPNPVLALENGTQGWSLAGLELERGSPRDLPPPPASAQRRAAQAEAGRAARGEDVPTLSAAAAQAWLDDGRRTTYVLDVRTEAEFRAGTLAGAVHAAGGQLLQATDLAIGVRGSRVLVLDDDQVRAPVVALWLRRLGFEAALVQDGIRADLRVPPRPAFRPPVPPQRDVAALAGLREKTDAPQPVLVDVRASTAYRRGHPRGAYWSIRPRLVADLERLAAGDRRRPVVLVHDHPEPAALAALELGEAGWTDVSAAPAAAFGQAGWPQDSTPDLPADADAIDYLFFVHDRHDGNLDAARRYLAWETGLIAQCTADELGVFRLPAAAPSA